MDAAFDSLTPEKLRALMSIGTPAYVVDVEKLRRNCEILRSIQTVTGCKILLAQKAFSCYDFYPLMAPYLAGTEASGLYEARLGYEKGRGEVHVFSAAYKAGDMDELTRYADHVIFNSPSQLRRFGGACKARGVSVGIRVNPECSTQPRGIYDPCAKGSRLGVTRAVWDREMAPELTDLLDGIHFHTLCEQDADALETTLRAVEQGFGDIARKMKWVNFGGGHHITRPGYDIPKLERLIMSFQDRYGALVYLEPGEAIALNAGYLVTTVLDIARNGDTETAVLDMSPACHTPDVLEMPYRPPLYGSAKPREKAHTYTLAGPTCLAGDVMGQYSFDRELREGDVLILGDMAIYTMCKNNTFNGTPLPGIYALHGEGSVTAQRLFGYEDFINRLGGGRGGV